MTMTNKFEKGRSLKEFNTLGIGGSADYFVEVHEISAMQEILRFCNLEGLPYFILGKGSNVLFSDLGFAGVVIANRISFLERNSDPIWKVGAGYSFSLLGTQTARQGWSGLEFASGIPGSVGGAIYMNAGANGHETCENLVSVDYVASTGEFLTFSKEDLLFSYRSSPFQKKTGAIVSATFHLTPSRHSRQKQLDILSYRKKTQPYDEKSAGCIFRNPHCAHAGALIEKCGLKGKRYGGAEVSCLHANFLINKSNATSNDMLALIDLVMKEVKNQTGYDLLPEVCRVPYTREGSEDK